MDRHLGKSEGGHDCQSDSTSHLIVMCLQVKIKLREVIDLPLFFLYISSLSSFQTKIKPHGLVILITPWFCLKRIQAYKPNSCHGYFEAPGKLCICVCAFRGFCFAPQSKFDTLYIAGTALRRHLRSRLVPGIKPLLDKVFFIASPRWAQFSFQFQG